MDGVETERISATQNFSVNLTDSWNVATTPPISGYNSISMKYHGPKNRDVLLLKEMIEEIYVNASIGGKERIIDLLRMKGFIVVEPIQESTD